MFSEALQNCPDSFIEKAVGKVSSLLLPRAILIEVFYYYIFKNSLCPPKRNFCRAKKITTAVKKQLTTLITLCFTITALYSQSNSNTIKIDAPVNLMLEKNMPASDYTTGDTVLVFTVTDDLKVNTPTGQSVLAIKKGAPAKAVVTSCVMPHKQTTKKGDRNQVFDGQIYYERGLQKSRQTGGEIILTIVAVQAIDGSFLPLSDCPITKIGGVDGGYKNDKQMAIIPAGTRKVCKTQYPNAILTY